MLQNLPIDLPELPYDFNALEPVISAQIMELHYTKHHKAYVANYNVAMEKFIDAEQKGDMEAMIALEGAIRFNGGGHINHSYFWKQLAPKGKGGGEEPKGGLARAIENDFGSFSVLKDKLSRASLGIQGSGWGWLGYNKAEEHLVVTTCANQDPLSIQGIVPLVGIDVWEHAYYLDYQNRRADYINNIWNIINWTVVADNFDRIKK